MKRIISFFGILFMAWSLFAQSPTATTQATPTALGLPGDNLNLYLVLNLFKQSSSIEDFEKRLNSPDTKVNNLDLNNDGSVDYLKVTDYGKNDYHTIVIQDIVSASETQDVAIIQLQKKEGNLVHIQIIGDESLYGKNYIIEPQLNTTASTAPASTAPAQPTTVINNNYYNTNISRPAPYVNVWGWPCVSFIFGPTYVPWVSPWSWAYYPTWWYARPRVIFSVYSGYYQGFDWGYYCRRDVVINQVRYNNYYNSHRVISNTVQTNITKNVYKNNYTEINNNTINNKSGVHTSSYPKNNFAPDKNYNSPSTKQGATDNATNFSNGQKENPIKINQTEKQNTPNTSTPKYGYGNNNGEWGGYNKPQKEEQGAQSSNPKWNNTPTNSTNNAEWGGYNKHTNSNTSDPVYNNKPSKQGENIGNTHEGYAPKGSASPETPKPPKWNNGGNNGGGKWNNGGGGYKGGGSYNGGGRHWGGGNGGGIRTGERRK